MINKSTVDKITKILFSISFFIFIFIITYSPFRYSVLSPDKIYRLDYYEASVLQKIWNREMVTPYTIYLYNNIQNKFFGKTPLLDIEDGSFPIWLPKKGRISVTGTNGLVAFENIPYLQQKKSSSPLSPPRVVFYSNKKS